MLDGIRKAANNWLGRLVLIVIMSVLILSFAVWGIGDMLRVTTATTVARVGKVDIGAEQVRTAYTTTLEDVSQRLRRRLTTEEARAFGLDRQVVSRLISESAVDQRAKALGLNLSEAEVVRAVMNEPGLKTANGQFDRARFFDILRQNGMNEAAFFADQKRAMLRRQLTGALAGDAAPPQALVEAAYRFASEQRVVKYFVLPASVVGDIAAPDEAAMKTFFDSRKTDFRAPEYRKIALLAALPLELGLDLTVTEADLRRVYDRSVAAGQQGAPAKRQVSQILYATEAEAAAAAAQLAAGTTFEALMAEKKISPADADLGMKTQAGFADPAIGAAAFATAEGAVSAPVKTGFGFALVKVTGAEAGTQIAFDDAKASLGPAAAAEKLRSDPRIQARLDEIQKKVEDAKIAGKSLAEAAPLAGLTLRTIEAIDNTGKDKAGALVALPGTSETVKAVFQSDIGLDNEALRLREGGLLWFEIAGVEPARDRAYDEVKAEALLRWRDDEAAKRLNARAAEDVAKIDGGAEIAGLAVQAGGELKEAAVNRNSGGDIGATGAAQAFATPVGKAATAALPGGGRLVMQVIESKLAPLDPASGVALQFRRQLTSQLSEDIAAQYIQKVQAELGVTTDAKALQTAIGGGG